MVVVVVKVDQMDEQVVDNLVVIARYEGVVVFWYGVVNNWRGECRRKGNNFLTTWNLQVMTDGNERENVHLNGFIK